MQSTPFIHHIQKKYKFTKISTFRPANFLGFQYFIGKDVRRGRWIFIKRDGLRGQAARREAYLIRLLSTQSKHSYFPNLVALEAGGLFPFVAVDYIHGVTLGKLLNKNTLKIQQKRQIIEQMLDILTILHRNKVIHRDIRPDNLMIRISKSQKVHVCLIDFSYAIRLKPHALLELPFLKKNRDILIGLGEKNYKPKPLKWDDAYSMVQTIRKLDPRSDLHYPDLWKRLRASVGKVTYTHS